MSVLVGYPTFFTSFARLYYDSWSVMAYLFADEHSTLDREIIAGDMLDTKITGRCEEEVLKGTRMEARRLVRRQLYR